MGKKYEKIGGIFANMGNSWGILATTSMRRRSRKILFAVRGGEEDICQNIFNVRRICYYSDFFIS